MMPGMIREEWTMGATTSHERRLFGRHVIQSESLSATDPFLLICVSCIKNNTPNHHHHESGGFLSTYLSLESQDFELD